MKRVAINALLLKENAGGIGVYLENFINYILVNDVGFEPVVYMPREWYESHPQYQAFHFIRAVDIETTNPVARILTEPFFWPKRFKKDKIDWFYSPISYIPLGVRIPSVLTVHDLRSFHEREYYTFLRYHFLNGIISWSVRQAQKVIAVSGFTANDIIERFHVDRDNVKVIYEGIDSTEYAKSFTADQLAEIKGKYGIKSPYILSVGHLEPRKNYPRLIRSFARLKKEHHIPHQLVIVGQENWSFQDIYRIVDELDLKDQVLFTKFVSQDHIPALYQMAEIFVTLSTFEGFGFTPLESMAAGTPVVVSNCTSLPEVVGDAALLCDPFDLEDIIRALWMMISDPRLQQDYVEKGYANIRRFDWNHGLAEVCKTIREL